MVDPITGVDPNQSVIADLVNRQSVGMSQRQRNEAIRQQTQQGISPEMSNLNQYGQATNPSEISDTWSKINRESFGNDRKYERAVEDAYNYSKAGFVPGHQVSGWKYKAGDPKFAHGGDFYGTFPTLGMDQWSRNGYKLRYDPLKGYQKIKPDSGGGFFGGLIGDVFGGIYDVLDPVLDLVNPLHDLFQDTITGVTGKDDPRQAFQMIAPIVASFFLPSIAGAAGGAAETGLATLPSSVATAAEAFGTVGGTLATDAALAAGAGAGGLTAAGAGATGSSLGSLFSTGNPYADQALQSGLKNFVASGGDPEAALKGALLGPVGQYFNQLGISQLGNIGGKMFGGAASGALNSLFTGNDPIRGSLYGGMSGGLHGYLNSINTNYDPFNRTLSNVITNTAKKKLARKL